MGGSLAEPVSSEPVPEGSDFGIRALASEQLGPLPTDVAVHLELDPSEVPGVKISYYSNQTLSAAPHL